MQYIFLKNIVESTAETFLCQACHQHITLESIQVLHINSNGIGMVVECPHCHSRSELRAEIHAMAQEMLKTEDGRIFFNEMIQKNGSLTGEKGVNSFENQNTIKESDIKRAEEEISGATTIEDLLK